MSVRTEFMLESTDGKSRLHVMKWLPDNGDVKAVLQISHGIVEHIGRYDSFARFVADNGFAVVGNSHLGHGQSATEEPDRGFFAEKGGWFTAVADMHKLYEVTHGEYPNLPFFILGHSMGSFMLRTMLINYQDSLSGCVVSGTGQQSRALLDVGLAVAGAEIALFGPKRKSPRLRNLTFKSNNRRIPVPRTPYDWLSRDPEIVDGYIADTDSGYTAAVGLYSDMLWGIRFIGLKKNIARMRRDIPILLVSGSDDPVGEYGRGPKKVYSLFRDAGLTDVTLRFYDGARHEILNETNRREVFEDILAWLNARVR